MDNWISISAPPEEGERVIGGHIAGWIEPDLLFRQGKFRKRHNANTGGDAGYKQKDWKKPDGNPASPDEWPWGAEVLPTHWHRYPKPPNP